MGTAYFLDGRERSVDFGAWTIEDLATYFDSDEGELKSAPLDENLRMIVAYTGTFCQQVNMKAMSLATLGRIDAEFCNDMFEMMVLLTTIRPDKLIYGNVLVVTNQEVDAFLKLNEVKIGDNVSRKI